MKKRVLFLSIFAILTVMFLFRLSSGSDLVSASDTSYPVQEIRISPYNSSRNINITGYSDYSALNTWVTNGEQNEKWQIKYVSDGIYKIVNSKTGKVITASNNTCVIASDQDSSNQKWYISSVQKDYLGNDLYYKITSYANASLAMTLNASSNSIALSSYSGATNQKWKLNCDGLEGFASNCIVNNQEKAGTIGGLLGKTVYVSTLSELKSALLKTEPLTIVLTANIDNCNDETYDLRIEDNKTLVGSYSANRLTDPRLRTDDYFKKEEVSDNIIIRNINVEVANREDVVAVAVYGSKNVWVDHCTFHNSLTMEYDEVGKFIWINTSNDTGENPDFVTLSYNIFSHRFWCVAFGTKTGTSEDHASVMYNTFDSVVHRAPQLGNGTLHVYNNYYVRNDGSIYNDGFASIKCGSGSVVYSDANRFEGYRKESSGYWDYEVTVDSNATFKDVGSYTNKSESGSSSVTPYALSVSDCKTTTWNPSSNYGYQIISAYGTNDVKSFCKTYAGCFSSYSKIKYITDSACSKYISKTVSNSFLSNSLSNDTNTDTGIIDTSKTYMIKNANSKQYLEVTNGTAANGTNVQQWGAYSASKHNTWSFKYAGNGYYYIYSNLGNGSTYLLDVDYGKTANGTNIAIYQNTNCDAQLFKLIDNGNGTYTLATKVSSDASCVEVKNGSTASGANVQEWEINGASCQHWILEAQ